MAASRRARLVNDVNRRDQETYARLRRASADLRAERQTLEDSRSAQAAALADLHDQATAIDAKLAAAQRVAAEQAAQAAATAAAAASASSTTAGTASSPTSAPTSTTVSPVAKPTPPPNYSGTPGTYAHHDDPFLTCVRQRESGGNYAVVSSAGYLGAYQFTQSTWNVTANHAGQPQLVGVPVNLATPYDQDHIAWTLYQWQGTAPWGGCP
ncbi:MAG: transglycosylase family protein [Acidimicrobiia bacterium]